ncbi:MAG: hypothetical protein A4E45_02282 [Methanosaeta sp. PtaB.Bin039]|nr:MAG: hypothetical protein A4E45_02282 [Methanosaeta sp. PtaB.Bin039]
MKVMLLANQPERTTRLQLFRSTLQELGYEVVVPSFGTSNWLAITRASQEMVRREEPDVLHIFNVPDIIYHKMPQLRGRFRRLIYDYRSPWGVETQMRFGQAGLAFCERFESELARSADLITTVNSPLRDKALAFAPDKSVHIIPNYPSQSFLKMGQESSGLDLGEGSVIFVGRVCEQEGVGNLLRIARACPDQQFWIVGGGPFSWWYLKRCPPNLRSLGWQPHVKVASLVRQAALCLIPREENVLTPYSTDLSIWKLNEYLNMGKAVLASGITREGDRKNLEVVKSSRLAERVGPWLERGPQPLGGSDLRFWESNRELIEKVYQEVV